MEGEGVEGGGMGRRKEGERREGKGKRGKGKGKEKDLLKIEQNKDIKRGTIYKCWSFYSWEDWSTVQICYLDSFPIPATNYYTNEAVPCRKELCL